LLTKLIDTNHTEPPMEAVFAYRVKSARIQKGVTQAQLAEALGISKQAVSQYENGKKNPESKTLIAMAKYFQKPLEYFLRPVSASLDQVEFRKRASLKGKKLDAVKATILEKLEPYLELEHILALDEPFENPLINFQIREVEDAENAAKYLLQSWKLGLNPIPNILEMLEDRGIKIIHVELDPKFDGLSTFVGDRIPIIVLNEKMDTLRLRFTAMHELGHLLLPIDEESDHKFKEAVCNRFAGAMLMPGGVLMEELGSKRQRISWAELIPIKEYYGISLAALMYRCKDLGILPLSILKRFWTLRNQHPNLKMEVGYGEYKGEERSARFEQLLSKALAEELITYSKGASLAGIGLTELKETYQLI